MHVLLEEEENELLDELLIQPQQHDKDGDTKILQPSKRKKKGEVK
jgi:hypothetical protein